MIHNTKCTMKEVLLSIKEKYLQEGESAVEEDNNWYIYETDDILSLSTPCYIAPRPEFDENEEELSKALNYYLDADTYIKL